MIKIAIYFIQSVFIYILFILGRLMGLKLSRKIFSFLFEVIGPIFKSKKIINKNLNYFSPSISDSEKENIVSNMWKNYGMTFIEYIFLDKFSKEKYHIKIGGEKNLKNIIETNKPAIFVSGHFANFELM